MIGLVLQTCINMKENEHLNNTAFSYQIQVMSLYINLGLLEFLSCNDYKCTVKLLHLLSVLSLFYLSILL